MGSLAPSSIQVYDNAICIIYKWTALIYMYLFKSPKQSVGVWILLIVRSISINYWNSIHTAMAGTKENSTISEETDQQIKYKNKRDLSNMSDSNQVQKQVATLLSTFPGPYHDRCSPCRTPGRPGTRCLGTCSCVDSSADAVSDDSSSPVWWGSKGHYTWCSQWSGGGFWRKTIFFFKNSEFFKFKV